jgi:hypothetical protein
MVAIDVDFEVYKELTARRRSESMSENEVIRELLRLSSSKSSSAATSSKSREVPWVVKGVTFPEDTEFRALYKGRQYAGKVKGGALIMEGRRHTSPSAAAVFITGHPVNGWRFWQCRMPGASEWKYISGLRA